MKKNTYIKILLFSVLLILFFAFLYQYFKKINNTEIVLQVTPKIEAPKLVSRNIENSKPTINTTVQKKEVISEVDINKVSVKIIIEGNVYQSKIIEGQSIYQAMTNLSEQNKDFTFTSKNYSGMGMFVDSINGVQGSFEKNWIYYVNDKKASIGISKNFLKIGDVVRWQREGLIN